MKPDIALAISVELQHFLKGDWQVIEHLDKFVVTNKDPNLSGDSLKAHLRETAWQIAQDVGYHHFVSVSEEPSGRITVVSTMESKDGFEIVFDA